MASDDRRIDFERKLDSTTHRDSLIKRGAVWHTAGQLTAQFLTELEDLTTMANEEDDITDEE